MSYPYSAENRLATPANYQYAAFGGPAYLLEYLSARQNALDAFEVRAATPTPTALARLLTDYAPHVPTGSLEALSVEHTIKTRTLLGGLAAWAASNSPSASAEIWLRRLIQRFEVSKRLYSAYPPGFRKGEGDFSQIDLYLLFAAVLCLRQLQTKNLQCLSTLLKATDLLCSLPAPGFRPEAMQLFALIVTLETLAVRKLADRKGLRLDA